MVVVGVTSIPVAEVLAVDSAALEADRLVAVELVEAGNTEFKKPF